MGLDPAALNASGAALTKCVALEEDSPAVALAAQIFKAKAEENAAVKQREESRKRALDSQLTLSASYELETRRRNALKLTDLYEKEAAFVAATANSLRVVDNEQFCDMLRTAYDLGWAHGRDGKAQPTALKLIHRTALTDTYLPRVVKNVQQLITQSFKVSATRGGGAYGFDGWKDTTGDEQCVSTFTAATESHLIRIRDSTRDRKQEEYFLRCCMEDLDYIFSTGGVVTIVCTDGAMTDWHYALRVKLRTKYPERPILVLTCTAHGVSLFFKDLFGVGRAEWSLTHAHGTPTWLAVLLVDVKQVLTFVMRHAVIKAIFLAIPESLALRMPQEQRMGNAYLLFERYHRDKRFLKELFNHRAVIEYVTSDQYGKKYKAEYEKLYETMIENAMHWNQVYKAVIMLEPYYMLLRRCDTSTPNLAWVAMAFNDALSSLRALPLRHDVGSDLVSFTVSEKHVVIELAEDRYSYAITADHRGASLFNPHYYLNAGASTVPDAWLGDLSGFLEHLYPGAANTEKRLTIRTLLQRMWAHEAPFDNEDAWAAAAKKDFDIAAWYSLYCHLPVGRNTTDMQPLREVGVLVGAGQCSAGQTERINKVVSMQLIKTRTLLTNEHAQQLSQLGHWYQQRNARHRALTIAGHNRVLDEPKLHESTLYAVHAEAVHAQREQQQAARNEFLLERAKDPEFMPPVGGMLDLLFNGDPEAGCVIDHGSDVANLLAAAVERSKAHLAAAGGMSDGAPADSSALIPSAAGPQPQLEHTQALKLWQMRHDEAAFPLLRRG